MRKVSLMSESTISWPPPTGWRKGRLLRPAAGRVSVPHAGLVLRAQSAPGDYALAMNAPGWSLHGGLDPQDDSYRCWMCSNGLVVKAPHSDDLLLTLFFTAPNVLQGFVHSGARPNLFSADEPVHAQDHEQRLDTNGLHIVLAYGDADNGQTFAVGFSRTSYEKAASRAQGALKHDPHTVLQQEMARRSQFLGTVQTRDADVALILEAHETLAGALRPPQGVLTHRWPESDTLAGAFSLNELSPLIPAWCVLDVTVAEDILRAAFGQVKSNGFLPAWVRPDGSHAESEMAWPTLALCSQWALDHGASDEFAAFALRRLSAYVGHALERFHRGGHYAWRSDREAFIPETFNNELATVDLAVFLLCETDAFMALADRYDRDDLVTAFIQRQRDLLRRHLQEYLWDDKDRLFRDRFIGGDTTKRTTLSSYLPLLWPGLDERQRGQTLKRLNLALGKRKQGGIDSWEHWESDPVFPTVPALHQAFVLQAVRTAGHEDAAWKLEQALFRALAHAFEARQTIPADLTGENPDADSTASSVMGAALAVNLVCRPGDDAAEGIESSKAVRWLDRHRTAVGLTVLGALISGLAVVVLTYQFKRTPTAVDMTTMTSLADRYYRDGRYDQAMEIYRRLGETEPGNRTLQLLLGNTLYRQGRLEEAERHYRRALDEDQPSPSALRNLAITLYEQGNLEEAARYFQMIIDELADRYPELATQAQTSLDIIEFHSSRDRP